MQVNGISDTELARIFEQLCRGGEVELRTADGKVVRAKIDRIDTATLALQEHDWV